MTTKTANPFDILPANLFNLFSTQGHGTLQRHYVAILLRIYELAEFNRFGLTREVVIAEIVDYLQAVDQEVLSEIDAEDDAAQDRTVAGGERNYAGYLLRRLEEAGWLEREQSADYVETIVLPDYAFTLLEALRAIQEQKPQEFTGQIYAAHQLLTNESTDFSPSLALTQAYENVRQVVRGLNELNQNIRRYTERATRGLDVAALLRLQYDDYAQVLGPAYHALKTSDHVSRYRHDIVTRLQAWQMDEEWLESTAGELAVQGRRGPAQAAEEIGHVMRFIVHQLEGLDPLLDEIDRRHAQYLRTSLRQIRYQLVNAEGSLRDRLVALGRGLAALLGEGQRWLPEEMPALQSQPLRAPDVNSFYTLPQRQAPLNAGPVLTPIIDPADEVSLRELTLHEIGLAITPDKVNRYVKTMLNGHRAVHVRDLPPTLIDDLPWLIYTIAYGNHPDVDYGVEPLPGDPVAVGSYRIMPFQLVKLSAADVARPRPEVRVAAGRPGRSLAAR